VFLLCVASYVCVVCCDCMFVFVFLLCFIVVLLGSIVLCCVVGYGLCILPVVCCVVFCASFCLLCLALRVLCSSSLL